MPPGHEYPLRTARPLFSLWHTAKAAPLSYPQIWRMCLSPLDPWLLGVSLQTLIIWHPFCVFIFPHYFALIFPAWPYRVASQWLRPFPGFIKSFFVAACSVFLFFGIRWQFYSPNSLKQKGLLARAVEWKGMPVLFFFFLVRSSFYAIIVKGKWCFYVPFWFLPVSLSGLPDRSHERQGSHLRFACGWICCVTPRARWRDSCVCFLISELRALCLPALTFGSSVGPEGRETMATFSHHTHPSVGAGLVPVEISYSVGQFHPFLRAHLLNIFLMYMKCQNNCHFLFFLFFSPGLTLALSSKPHLCWEKPYMLSSGQIWWWRTFLSLPPPFPVMAIITRFQPGCLPGKRWLVDYLHRWLEHALAWVLPPMSLY